MSSVTLTTSALTNNRTAPRGSCSLSRTLLKVAKVAAIFWVSFVTRGSSVSARTCTSSDLSQNTPYAIASTHPGNVYTLTYRNPEGALCTKLGEEAMPGVRTACWYGDSAPTILDDPQATLNVAKNGIGDTLRTGKNLEEECSLLFSQRIPGQEAAGVVRSFPSFDGSLEIYVADNLQTEVEEILPANEMPLTSEERETLALLNHLPINLLD